MPALARFFGLSYGTSFDAQRWLSLDPCGFGGITLSWTVHLFALTVLATHVISQSWLSTLLYFSLYVPCAILAMASLYMASTTDPGAVPLGARPLTKVRRASSGEVKESAAPVRGMRRCGKCQDNYKPARAHHDSVTGRCIVKFDHFCPWVNNAVGALNHKYFCLFLLYTACSCLLSLLLLILRVVHCGYVFSFSHEDQIEEAMEEGNSSADSHDSSDTNGRWLELSQHVVHGECHDFFNSHLVLGLVISSLVFLIFTCSMGCEQLEAIETGKGKIARMKMKVGSSGTEYSTVTEEFNEMFGGESPHLSWHWLIPVPVRFPRGMKKVVLGYEWDESFEAVAYQEDDSNHGSESGGNSSGSLQDVEEGRATPTPSPPASSGSVKNRRLYQNNSGLTLEDGLSMVERNKARLT